MTDSPAPSQRSAARLRSITAERIGLTVKSKSLTGYYRGGPETRRRQPDFSRH